MCAAMTKGHLIVQASTFEGAQGLISEIMSQFDQVTATLPVKAADGSYLASVHYWGDAQKEIRNVDSNATRIL